MFRLCDEIHFVCDGVFGMVKRRYQEDTLDRTDSTTSRISTTGRNSNTGRNSSSVKRSQSRRARRNQKSVEANTLIEVLKGDVDLDNTVRVEILENEEKLEIPSQFIKVIVGCAGNHLFGQINPVTLVIVIVIVME